MKNISEKNRKYVHLFRKISEMMILLPKSSTIEDLLSKKSKSNSNLD